MSADAHPNPLPSANSPFASGARLRLAVPLLVLLGGCRPDAPASTTVDPELLRTAERRLLDEDFEQVERLLEPVVSREHPTGRAELLYALSQHKRKRYARALPWFDAAGTVEDEWDGRDALPYYRGWCLYYLGDLDGSEAAFEAHRAFEPSEGDSVFALGLIAFDRGESGIARERFVEAIALHEAALAGGAEHLLPDLSKCWARLGEVHAAEGDDGAARDALWKAVSAYPPHAAAWYQLGSVLERLGDADGAAKAFELHKQWSAAARGAAAGGESGS